MRTVIHIGCEKTGTTTLQKYLFQSFDTVYYNGEYGNDNFTGIKSVIRGEMDIETAKAQWNQKVESVSDTYDTLLHSKELYTSTHLSEQLTVAETVREIVGNANILITVRRQPDICVSHYFNFIGRGEDREFTEFMEDGIRLLEEKFDVNTYEGIPDLYNREWGVIWSTWQYDDLVDIWSDQFDEVSVIPLEGWQQDPRRTREAFSDLLEVTEDEITIPSKRARSRSSNFALRRVRDLPFLFRIMNSGNFPDTIDNYLRKKFLDVELTNEQRRRIDSIYGARNRTLSKKLNWDFQAMDYPGWEV